MEIKIGKSAKQCCVCERNFVHEEALTSRAHVAEDGLLRDDYCATCWKPELAKGAYSVWNLVFYDAEVAEREPEESFSPLRQLFYEAVEAADRAELAKAYLAAQLLRRQKVFRLIKHAEEREDGVRLDLFADRIGNRLIEVRDPNLSHQEMEAGRQGLLTRLEELENPQSTGEVEANAGREED